MFSLFKKSAPTIPYSDKIWKKALYARKGLVMMAMLRLQQSKACLIVNFFESEAEALIDFLKEHKLEYVRWDEGVSNEKASTSLYLLQANDLLKPSTINFLKQNINLFSKEVLFSDHYPIDSVEQLALKNLAACGFDKFIFCLSFEDPLLKLFASQNILPLLEKLGLEEEEAIEHSMVTKSIQRAREKVESTVTNEIHTKSPEEWFALNAKK